MGPLVEKGKCHPFPLFQWSVVGDEYGDYLDKTGQNFHILIKKFIVWCQRFQFLTLLMNFYLIMSTNLLTDLAVLNCTDCSC